MKKTLFFQNWDSSFPLPWKPIVDKNANKPFIPLSFEEAIAAGNYDNYFPEEGESSKNKVPFKKDKENDINNEEQITSSPLVQKSGSEEKSFIPAYTEANLKKMEEILSTAWFHAPLQNDLDKLVDGGVKAYTFKFCYQGSFSMVDVFRLNIMGQHKYIFMARLQVM